jgi:hypothetical protein
MAQPEARDQAIQVLHEYDRDHYTLIFIDPASGRRLTQIGMPNDQMLNLVTAIVANLQEVAP